MEEKKQREEITVGSRKEMEKEQTEGDKKKVEKEENDEERENRGESWRKKNRKEIDRD